MFCSIFFSIGDKSGIFKGHRGRSRPANLQIGELDRWQTTKIGGPECARKPADLSLASILSQFTTTVFERAIVFAGSFRRDQNVATGALQPKCGRRKSGAIRNASGDHVGFQVWRVPVKTTFQNPAQSGRFHIKSTLSAGPAGRTSPG